MTTLDVTSLTKDDLLKLQKRLDKAIRTHDERRRRDALAAAEAKAREMGFSLSELTGATGTGGTGTGTGTRGTGTRGTGTRGTGARGTGARGTVNPPRYRHPENPAKTWTGRGRQPDWIKEALNAGKSLDDFLIAS